MKQFLPNRKMVIMTDADKKNMKHIIKWIDLVCMVFW